MNGLQKIKQKTKAAQATRCISLESSLCAPPASRGPRLPPSQRDVPRGAPWGSDVCPLPVPMADGVLRPVLSALSPPPGAGAIWEGEGRDSGLSSDLGPLGRCTSTPTSPSVHGGWVPPAGTWSPGPAPGACGLRPTLPGWYRPAPGPRSSPAQAGSEVCSGGGGPSGHPGPRGASWRGLSTSREPCLLLLPTHWALGLRPSGRTCIRPRQ